MRFSSDVDAAILNGKASPKTSVKRVAEIIQRPPTLHMQNNAPTQRIETVLLSNKQITNVQHDYLQALRNNKVLSKTTNGAASWIGKSFG